MNKDHQTDGKVSFVWHKTFFRHRLQKKSMSSTNQLEYLPVVDNRLMSVVLFMINIIRMKRNKTKISFVERSDLTSSIRWNECNSIQWEILENREWWRRRTRKTRRRRWSYNIVTTVDNHWQKKHADLQMLLFKDKQCVLSFIVFWLENDLIEFHLTRGNALNDRKLLITR